MASARVGSQVSKTPVGAPQTGSSASAGSILLHLGLAMLLFAGIAKRSAVGFGTGGLVIS